MTDIRNAGTPRETLYTIIPAAQVTLVAREVLLVTPTALTVAGAVREVLMLAAPLLGGQTAVTINTG